MIRYAVVGAGWISQEAFLPGAALVPNAKVAALVSGHPRADELAAFHGIPEVLGYDGYDELIASDRIDAVYVALPNSMHADYSIRALRAGKHVMVEKPLATTLPEAEAMVAAARSTGKFLMTAYRLHNEPATLAVLDLIRNGRIGTPRFFSAAFAFQAGAGNHRLQAGHWGGPLQDVGVYCLNAARHAFGEEPIAVQAMAARPDDPRFAEIDASLAVTLRFPGDRLAQFFCSFGTHLAEYYRVLGDGGEIILDPGFRFESAFRLTLRTATGEESQLYPQTDHFAGQIAYFSDCIAGNVPPEADGEEGLADMVGLLAIEQAVKTGGTVAVDLPARNQHPSATMARHFPPATRKLLF